MRIPTQFSFIIVLHQAGRQSSHEYARTPQTTALTSLACPWISEKVTNSEVRMGKWGNMRSILNFSDMLTRDIHLHVAKKVIWMFSFQIPGRTTWIWKIPSLIHLALVTAKARRRRGVSFIHHLGGNKQMKAKSTNLHTKITSSI